MKQLILNADDYGRTAAISAGIRHTHQNGLITTTTAMMNFPTTEADLQIARAECPGLGLGVHLTLTAGRPVLPAAQVRTLVNSAGAFLKLNQFEQALDAVDLGELKAEWRAQIEKFLATGAALDHLDSHHHTAYFTEGALSVMLDLAREYGAPVRRPQAMSEASDRTAFAERLLAEKPAPCPDHFITGFYDEGVSLANLLDILDRLPEGVTEIMSHPGYVDDEILRDSAYNRQREREIEVLTDPAARQALEAGGIRRATFRSALG